MPLFAIVHKDTKELLSPASFKKFWPNYGSSIGSGLYGWRPPKKTYDTLGRAKAGFAHIPEKLKSELEIAEFIYSRSISDGEELREEQRKKKEKKAADSERKAASRKINFRSNRANP